jgi:hypothetical protein
VVVSPRAALAALGVPETTEVAFIDLRTSAVEENVWVGGTASSAMGQIEVVVFVTERKTLRRLVSIVRQPRYLLRVVRSRNAGVEAAHELGLSVDIEAILWPNATNPVLVLSGAYGAPLHWATGAGLLGSRRSALRIFPRSVVRWLITSFEGDAIVVTKAPIRSSVTPAGKTESG